MDKLSELKEDLSNELKRGKSDRNNGLIETLQNRIREEKAFLQDMFKNNRKKKHDAEVKLRVSYYLKMNVRYAKIRSGGGLAENE